ncbi:mraZ isoform X2 [Tasmannia lanceolata]|uniref:mraZ isoform X2 n=1 Tax=Tasmannia lanceolata TaxID=3420 RepID=UPI00406281A2
MVMHPVLKHRDYFWRTLPGHLFISMLFLSSVYHMSRGHESETLFENYIGSFLSSGYGRNSFQYIERPVSSSSWNSISCEDLRGVGSLNSTCLLNSSLHLEDGLNISGTGNLEILPHVSILCPIKGCLLTFNLSGNVTVGQYATLIAGSIVVTAGNLTLDHHSSINTTSLGGPPPSQTSGTPIGNDGAGGGHGGRGASCQRENKTNLWGGDVYAWSTLSEPWSYGSKGASTSADKQFGGSGGGRVMLTVKDVLYVDGSVSAEGGDGGFKGGGGSGGSIIIHALKLKGTGTISAAGGRGWGGGGGGRISLECYSMQEDVKVTVHGGESIGCPGNAGAAGTVFDATLLSLKVSNDNVTTRTETPLLDFPTSTLWSNVFVESNAKVLVPLLWTRVQVRGQFSLLDGGSISFGLSDYPVSEFELVAEELLMSDSVLKVYGAFRVSVKMLLMWNSVIQIDGGDNTEVGTSVLEVRNLVVLRHNSVISSNANLGVYGQGLLRLTGIGDAIKGQRLSLSLFYNIAVGPGSLLQAPLDNENATNLATKSYCESQTCPVELLYPPEDCHVNNSLSFTLQICRVEDLTVNGFVKGSIIHIHRARTVTIDADGVISASELGCKEGLGKGKYLSHGAGGGGGHGGRGGSGLYNGRLSEGGKEYGDADLPCELGSGSGGSSELDGHAAGGGMIVMGSIQWPLSRLDIYGSLKADGQSRREATRNSNGTVMGGLGGGSGGTILLFLQALTLGKNASLSLAGGNGGPVGGGGGGGGRVHFDWSEISTGDEFVEVATVNGTIGTRGGNGSSDGHHGEEGTATGKRCPKGLYGTFCNECPVGTYKDVDGSDPSLCTPCPLELLPHRADFVYVRGGATQSSCPYKCVSEKYRMPNCYTPLEDLIYTFGGPWPFAFVLSFTLVILAVLLTALRIKLVGSDYSYQASNTIESRGSHPFPYLLSLAEVRGGSRAEETQSHVYRMYFMGPNTFREPWHLPYTPPDAIIDIVYEDAFNRFIDEINSVASYEWWEGSVHSILSVVAYPCAWSWKQWRRRNKIHHLQEYVKSEYDHACLRSCRSRALYKGMKVGSTPDLVVSYIDFFLGGDEKRLDLSSSIPQRFPMCIIFGGDGSYMLPYHLQSDTLLTNLLAKYIPTTIWTRFVTGLNAQLRTVRQGCIRSALVPVINWISSHGNPQLESHGVRVELGWFQATASGYYQLGILVAAGDFVLHHMYQSDASDTSSNDRSGKNTAVARKNPKQLQHGQAYASLSTSRKRISGRMNGGIINTATLQSLEYRRDFLFPFSLLLCNTRPIGLQDTLQLLISIMLLGDFTVTLLTLVQFYWISLGAFLAVLLILPLSLLSPFPAGLNALFSRGPRRSSLARVYALWNTTSLSNIFVAFACGFLHYGLWPSGVPEKTNTWNFRRDDDKWWILPATLLLIKIIQARFVDWHIANLEIQDPSLFSQDPESFWSGS